MDHRADIYAVGVMLYEAVTGALPFEADNPNALLFKIATQDPAPPSAYFPTIPPEFEAIIEKAMAKNPDDRFYSAAELFAALRPFGAHDYAEKKDSEDGWAIPPEPVEPAPAPPPPERRSPSATSALSTVDVEKGTGRRSRLPLVAGAVALVALLATTAALLVPRLLRYESDTKPAAPVKIAPPPLKMETEPAPKTYRLKVTATPPGARIKLDGTPLAGNPAEAELKAGEDHVVTAEAEGFDPGETWVNLAQDRAVTLDLHPAAQTVATEKPKAKVKKDTPVEPVIAPEPPPPPPPPKEKEKGKKVITDDWDG